MKTLLLALSLSLINDTPVFAGPVQTGPASAPNACETALESHSVMGSNSSISNSEKDVLKLGPIFESEDENSRATTSLMATVLRVLSYESPVSKIQKQVDEYFRSKKIITSTLKFGPLSKWYFSLNVKGMVQSGESPIKIETAEHAVEKIQTISADIERNLEALKEFETKLNALIEQQHQQIEKNLSTASEVTKKIKEIEPIKNNLDSIVNLSARERSTKKAFDSQISQLSNLIPILNKRTESSNIQLHALEEQLSIISALRSNLMAIKNAEVPSLMASLPKTLALKLTRSKSSQESLPAASSTGVELHKSLLFGGVKYDPIALYNQYMSGNKLGTVDFLDMSDLTDVNIKDTESLWKIFDKAYSQNNPLFFEKSKFVVLKIDRKNKLTLGKVTGNQTVEIKKFEDLIFTPKNFSIGTEVSSENHFVNSGDKLISVRLIGFTGAGDLIYEDDNRQLYNEKDVQRFASQPRDSEILFGISRDKGSLIPINYIGTDSNGQKFYQYQLDGNWFSGPLEKLKNNNFEILAPPKEDSSSDIYKGIRQTIHKIQASAITLKDVHLAGIDSKGEEVYYTKNDSANATYNLVNKKDLTIVRVQSKDEILAPNVYNVKTGGFVAAINTSDFYGKMLKSILDRLSKGESLSTAERTIFLDRVHISEYSAITAADLSLRLKYYGKVQLATAANVVLHLYENKTFSESETLPLSNYIFLPSQSPEIGTPSITGRFHLGDTFKGNGASDLVKVISSFKVGGHPYILCLRKQTVSPFITYELMVLNEDTLE